MKTLYFEEYEIGMVFESGTRTVTWYDVSAFVGLCGFSGPMWMDLDYVSRPEYYSGRVAPGLLVLSLVEGAISATGILADRGLALMEMTPTWKEPVLAGETVFVRSEVIALHLTSKGDRGVVTTDNVVHTTNGKTPVTYKAVRMVKAKSFDA